MTRLLWVTDEPPDRSRGGGSIRQAELLRRVARQVETHLVVTSPPEDHDAVSGVASLTVTPAVAPPDRTGWRRGPDLARKLVSRDPVAIVASAHVRAVLAPAVARLAPTVDVVAVEHDWLAGLLPRTRTGAAWSLTLHYLPSLRSRQWEQVADGRLATLRWRMEAARCRRAERHWVDAYDGVVVTSPEDRDALGGGTLVPNGVDADRFHPAPLPPGPRLVLTGSLDYEPNVDGAIWFVQQVWPRVRARVPAATLEIVGRRPVRDVRGLAAVDGVAVVPDVPAVLPHLHAARVAVVPIRIGSGTRLKALEAMAAGRPVVGTSVGMAGLGVDDGATALLADDPPAMAEAVVELLEDDVAARRLARAGRDHAVAHFGWDTLAATYRAHLAALASRSQTATSPSAKADGG